MGWSFCYSQTMDDLVKERLADKSWNNDKGQTVHQRTVAHSKRGNNLWYVVELTTIIDATAKTIRRYLALDLLAKDRTAGVGYKDLCETMGPSEVNCPLYLLDLVPCPTDYGYAVEWRERVRQWHSMSKEQRKERGKIVLEKGKRYALKQVRLGHGKAKLYWARIVDFSAQRPKHVYGFTNDGNVYLFNKSMLGNELMEKEVTFHEMNESLGGMLTNKELAKA